MTETRSNVEKANYSGEKNNLTKINTSNKKHSCFQAERTGALTEKSAKRVLVKVQQHTEWRKRLTAEQTEQKMKH